VFKGEGLAVNIRQKTLQGRANAPLDIAKKAWIGSNVEAAIAYRLTHHYPIGLGLLHID
jgi:hypothetical protein